MVMPAPPPRLLGQLAQTARQKHYSYRTEQRYSHWVKRFILFHGKRHASSMCRKVVEAFLTHLAVDGRVSASTQNQAMASMLFLDQSCRPARQARESRVDRWQLENRRNDSGGQVTGAIPGGSFVGPLGKHPLQGMATHRSQKALPRWGHPL